MSDKLYKAIAVAFKINPDEFIATLKDGDDWLSEDAISDKVTELVSTKVTAAKTDSRKSGQAEQNAKILKIVKASGFENIDNLQGSELLTAFTAWKDEQIVPPAGDTPVDQMDKETLLKLPIVKSLVLEAKQESGRGVEAVKQQFDAYKAQVEQDNVKRERERAINVAERHTEEAARKGNIVLKVEGVDEKVRLKSIFDVIRLNESIGLDAKGLPIVLGEDGEQKKDDYGNPIPFSDIVVSYGKGMYGVSAIPQTHEGANPPINAGVPGSKDYVPKYRLGTIEDYDKKYMETSDPSERLEINRSKQFHAEKAAGN